MALRLLCKSTAMCNMCLLFKSWLHTKYLTLSPLLIAVIAQCLYLFLLVKGFIKILYSLFLVCADSLFRHKHSGMKQISFSTGLWRKIMDFQMITIPTYLHYLPTQIVIELIS
uniref:Uncharacterized protein n=1 Tax=Cacopsylla melanoneura TaxID=428564 RepID=A0A8D8XHC3_9HEMI